MDEDNGRGGTQENGRFWKLQRFSRNELWKNIGCLLSATIFVFRGSILWEKDKRLIRKKRKRYFIQSKVDFYEVCASLFQIVYYLYYLCTNTSFPSAIFVVSLTPGERSLGSIGQVSPS